ncbi:FadR/GntR family transcriptional regulator [Desulfitobacterium metallireducens]|uniref:GntR family transcriptional regulator n=1 Tax=Desulfitobacterium metallireducens DSM 15288 TaxID=871968 RepID=W0EDN0_9FIRM|nr:FadR/GntR family transcriptional regulator [Desulfitobacterium metallireducens]AHF07299.1 GntR family transcriptional regulator [Desulfitobacterium metallireducens DSM 15288]
MELKPIKTRKIYEEIVEQIRELVMRGELRPGDKLPSERDLVARLQVSRASIREALSALEMMGLLEVRSGEGTFMRKLRPESVIAPLAWMLSIEKGTAQELLEVRKILEVQAAQLAAQRAQTEDLHELEEALEDMRQEILNPELGGEKADLRFHYAVTRATKNKILILLMDTISDMMQQMLKTSRSKLYAGKYTPNILYMEHAQIYEAVKMKDPLKASEHILEHLNGVEEELHRHI